MADAYRLASRCFALARSTTFAGEREAAVARGTAIAEKAGLSLDLFDIPGRARAAPGTGARRPAVASRQRSVDPHVVDIREKMRRYREHMSGAGWSDSSTGWTPPPKPSAFDDLAAAMERAEREAGVQPGETIYEARQRNFERACREARERDARSASA